MSKDTNGAFGCGSRFSIEDRFNIPRWEDKPQTPSRFWKWIDYLFNRKP